MTLEAQLIQDLGLDGSDSEFFRSAEFLAAEGVTHTLAVEEGLHLPVILRPIEGTDRRDAISPYGYPGARENPTDPPDAGEVAWSDTGLVSLFVRDRIGERTCLADGTLRTRVHIADGTDGIRKRLREQIRRNERQGWEIRFATGPEDAARLAAFKQAYDQTMSRTGAAARYLYPSEYFETLLKSGNCWLLTAEREGVGLAGAIAVRSDGYLHYYLGGTADDALGDSPMKNLFAAMIDLGTELAVPVNLGGGIKPGDSLDDFKRGFATGEAPWYTHEVICDPAAYAELSGAAAGESSGFFPAYRG